MAKDDDDEPFDGLDVGTDSDLPVHEEFVSNKKLRKSKKGSEKDIRKF
jgi:hypothetical protein